MPHRFSIGGKEDETANARDKYCDAVAEVSCWPCEILQRQTSMMEIKH